MDAVQTKRIDFLMLSKAPAMMALLHDTMNHSSHASLTANSLKWACRTVPKSMKRHGKIYDK